jgi:hypothetical protein
MQHVEKHNDDNRLYHFQTVISGSLSLSVSLCFSLSVSRSVGLCKMCEVNMIEISSIDAFYDKQTGSCCERA